MTKQVRIENADGSNQYQVRVDTWEKQALGVPDVLVETIVLENPGDLMARFITPARYLVVQASPSPL